jgi:hypothetical protein
MEESKQLTLKDEVEWCINQLLIGLISVEVAPEQVKESRKVIAKLQNPKTSLVAKRHLMRTVFGDYKKRIKECPLERTRKALENTDIAALSAQLNLPLIKEPEEVKKD